MRNLENRIQALESKHGVGEELTVVLKIFSEELKHLACGVDKVLREPGEEREAFLDRAIPLLRKGRGGFLTMKENG